MRKNISPNDCKSMFSDKFTALSMKELGIELKHFAIGTAPEYPSYLVNQDGLKRKLIEKFSNFFDTDRSQGLEVVFLRSNYGNGKSHFIRTIHSFLNGFENVIAKRVSLKQEKTDLKTKILEGIGQKFIKDSATFFVDLAATCAMADERETVLLTLCEKFNINSLLAVLIYEAARSQDISKQSQAIAILKRNYLPTYLRTFGLKNADLNSELYFDVIRLVCEYLYEEQYYIVIVFDEYEHVYSWRDVPARRIFFEDIKLFTDNLDMYKNLFFVFAESESVDNNSEISDDPAFVSRKKGRTYQIENISSETEVQKLFKMIKVRYEKYYDISLETYEDEIFEAIRNDSQVKTNSNYRNYTQLIMRILDDYRNRPVKVRRVKKISSVITPAKEIISTESSSDECSFNDRWKAANSISKKTFLCEALEHILEHSNERIINKSKKRGIYLTEDQKEKKEYHIIVTDNPSNSDFIKRYNEILRIQSEIEISKSIILYPYKQDTNNEFKYENVIFYDVDEAPNILDKICVNDNFIEDVFSCLRALEKRC